MDEEIVYPAGPDTMCDRAAMMVQLAANVDATSHPEAQALLLRTMECLLSTIWPKPVHLAPVLSIVKAPE